MKFIPLITFFLSSVAFPQSIALVDFKKADASIMIDPSTKTVSGKAIYEFEVAKSIDTIKVDAINMTFSDVTINGKNVKFVTTAVELKLFEGFRKGKNTLAFTYSAKPKQTMYFTGSGESLQIWTQGQGKNTSYWLPSFNDVNEKVVFNISATFDKDFDVISNGRLQSKKTSGENALWKYEMKKPMSSYLVMLAIGKFSSKTEKAASGIPLQMYYRPEDEAKFATTYKHSKRIFDFLEREIGVNYPWEIYKQVPVQDFLYAGMENTTATIFAQDFVVDEIGFTDKNYINVNAHELAHQWFGDMVTAASGKHHWLQEGFATYYALLAEKEIFGEDHFNWKLYEMAGNLQQAAKTDSVAVLNEKASALTFYQKGAWALHVLREGVGAEKFRVMVKNYLQKYGFRNVTTEDFLAEVKKVSDYDIDSFRQRWLEKPGFEVHEALTMLKKNPFMKQYLDVLDMEKQPLSQKQEAFSRLLVSDVYYPIKEEIIYQTRNTAFEEKEALLKLAMNTNDVMVRQAVAQSVPKIPASFYGIYKSLLDDNSYITQEMALGNLWQQFPENQHELLDKMQQARGFNDLNLRLQWLTLALITKDYRPSDKVKFYDELLQYASPRYEASIRQNALENLLYINSNDTNVLPLLVSPLTHHKWQFSKFAREKIRDLIKKPVHREFYVKLAVTLPEAEKTQLERLLTEK
ncbi:MAG TPA: M1 family metallopeptidase [Flavobacterium sp.]